MEAEGAIASPLCKVGGKAPLLFTVFNSLLLINNTYFIKLCLFHTDLININTEFVQAIPITIIN